VLVLQRGFGIHFGAGFNSLALVKTANGQDVFRWLLAVNTVSRFLLPALIFGFYYDDARYWIFTEGRPPRLAQFAAAIGIVVFAMPFVYSLYDWNSQLSFPAIAQWLKQHRLEGKENEQVMTALISDSRPLVLGWNVLALAIVPAIAEELFFRGSLLRILQQNPGRSSHMNVWFSAFIFSLLHADFDGFLLRLLLGALLGYLYIWSKNIWLSAAAHAVHNGLAVVLSWLFATGRLVVDPEKWLMELPWYFVVLASAVGAMGIGYLFKSLPKTPFQPAIYFNTSENDPPLEH
jgi:membrane protease YdiL (CAAX protease family)